MFSILKGDQLIESGFVYKFTHKTTHGRYCFINAEGSPIERTEAQLTTAWLANDLVLNPVDDRSPNYKSDSLLATSTPCLRNGRRSPGFARKSSKRSGKQRNPRIVRKLGRRSSHRTPRMENNLPIRRP